VEMNAALVAAAAVNGRVELLEGTYNTILTLSVAVNVTFVGNGWGSEINFNAAGNAITIAGDNVKLRDFKVVIVAGAGGAGTRPNAVYATARENVEISKLWLYGDVTVADDGSDERQVGILFGLNMVYCKILDNTIENFDKHGINLNATIGDNHEYIEIEGNISHHNNGVGIRLAYVLYCSIVGNTCHYNYYDGIYLRYSGGCTVDGNNCNWNDSDGINLFNCVEITVVGNHCDSLTYGIDLSTCLNVVVTGNNCKGAYSDGISLASCLDCTVTGNNCYENEENGINLWSTSDRNTVVGNNCWRNQYYGIRLYSSDHNTVTGNVCSYNYRHGILLRTDCNENSIVGNNCYANDYFEVDTYDGICIEDDCDYNLVMCNTCNYNDRWGISIGIVANSCVGNWVKDNHLRDNTSGPFSDQGTDTKLATKIYQFIQGTTFISDSAAAKGWEIDDVDEWAIALGQLPLELQQVVRIKIWAVALGAPIDAGGQMHLDILINAGASNLAYTTETIGLVSFDGEETDYVATDVVHWLIDAGDDADINDLAGGMSVECKVIYRVGDDPDGATNATFRCVEVEYV